MKKNLLKKSFRKKTFSIFFWKKKIAFQKMKFQKIKNVIFSKSKISKKNQNKKFHIFFQNQKIYFLFRKIFPLVSIQNFLRNPKIKLRTLCDELKDTKTSLTKLIVLYPIVFDRLQMKPTRQMACGRKCVQRLPRVGCSKRFTIIIWRSVRWI